ncbi:MAG: ligase-associated DNA damage response endonuclease PdeM [Ginsengibacter sp.]
MPAPFKFILNHQTLWLSHERCIFWEDQKALIVSDLHFGKSGHFRKAGIGVPQNIYKEDLQRLFSLIQFFNPGRLIIVGDLFHSHANKEIDLFVKWRNDVPNLSVELIKGNHDILAEKYYQNAGISTTTGSLTVDQFCFTHDIALACESESQYIFSGHIHPGISVSGVGKQTIYLPCFYFGETFAVLPAFSKFTGLSKIRTDNSKDKFFAIVKDQIIRIK